MTDPTIRVRVTGSQFRFDREQYARGDELEIPERVAAKHPQTVEPVKPDETEIEAEAEDDEAVTADDLDPHPSELKVGELEERIAGVEDTALLETILEAEKQSEDRSTAVEAIEDRLNELEG